MDRSGSAGEDAKKATPSEEEMRRQMTMTDQENMLLPLSKKRTFQEALAALAQESLTTVSAVDPIQVFDTTPTRLRVGTGGPGPSLTASFSVSASGHLSSGTP